MLRPRPAPDPKADRVVEDRAAELERLRELLLERERGRLDALERAVEEGELDAQRVSDLLPEAILLRGEGDEHLPRALAPTLESSFEDSVRRNPRTLANVIYPVIGPAIRQSIRNSLTSLLEGFNQALEHSVSARGLSWRLEAWRTGRPFSEVVLVHSLVYRVEQVFLVHAKSGLLLEHVYAPSITARDPDLVSSMLAALRDFVEDSFSVDGGRRQEVSQISFQELTLVVQPGPDAVLAAVVRGAPPTELRGKLEVVLERVHSQRASELVDFDGDVEPFRATVPLLEDCLVERRRAKSRGRSRALGLLLIGALASALVWLLLQRLAADERWDTALAALRSEPGIVLIATDDSAKEVRGMRDPLSRDPGEVLSSAGVDADGVRFVWEPFASHAPSLVLARARERLAPAESVDVAFDDGELRLSGSASHAWIQEALQVAAVLPGVARVTTDGLVDTDRRELELATATLEAARLRFDSGSAELVGERWLAENLSEAASRLAAAAENVGVDLRLHLIGGAAPGEDPALALARAESVRSRLRPEMPRRVLLVTEAAPAPSDFREVRISVVKTR